MKARVPSPAQAPRHAVAPSRAPQASRTEVRRILAGPRLQPKLTVGAPDDQYEREADQVAERVMRMPAPGGFADDSGAGDGALPPRVQRACACGGTCAKCSGEEETVRRAAEGPEAVPEIEPDVAARIGGLRGRGVPLSESSRQFFEPRLGRDLSGVRVHTDPGAASLASRIQARAFTYGTDIAFAAGEFNPGTVRGDRLIAHELTHVVQQGGARSDGIRRQEDDASDLDVIDERIDVAAQRALLRMRSREPDGAARSQELLGYIKSGELRGFVGDDLRMAADHARELGTVRWELVPEGQDAAVVQGAEGSPPLAVFKERVRDDRDKMDRVADKVHVEAKQILAKGGGGGKKTVPANQPCGTAAVFSVHRPDLNATFFLCKDPTETVLPGNNPMIQGKENGSFVRYFVGTWRIADPSVTASLPTDAQGKEVDPEGIWGNYELGFIQTIDPRFIVNAEYTNLWNAARVSPRARDADSPKTPEPWFNPAGVGAAGPVTLEEHLDQGKFPFLGDSPNLPYPTRLPEKEPCGNVNLNGFDAVGVFHIWLIVRPTFKPLSVDNIVFLKHYILDITQTASLKPNGDPWMPVDWQTTNNSSITTRENGKGSTDPALTGTIANQFINRLVVVPGVPCQPIKLGER